MTVGSTTPAGFEDRKDLFEIGDRKSKFANEEIEQIIYEFCVKDRDLKYANKVTYFDTRYKSQDEHAKISDEKIKTYGRTFGLYLDGASVVLNVGAAFAGGMSGTILQAMAHGATSMSTYRKQGTEGEVAGLDHRYQRINGVIGDRSQQIQAADKDFEQDSNVIERVAQMMHRAFELMASSSS